MEINILLDKYNLIIKCHDATIFVELESKFDVEIWSN